MTAGPAMMAQTGARTRGDPGIAGVEHTAFRRDEARRVAKPWWEVVLQAPKETATSKSSRLWVDRQVASHLARDCLGVDTVLTVSSSTQQPVSKTSLPVVLGPKSILGSTWRTPVVKFQAE